MASWDLPRSATGKGSLFVISGESCMFYNANISGT